MLEHRFFNKLLGLLKAVAKREILRRLHNESSE